MTEKRRKAVGFELSVSGRADGTVEAVYIRFSQAPVAETRELKRNLLVADYDARGRLVGVELLGPVSVSFVVQLVDDEQRDSFRRFIQSNLPRAFRKAA
jgi:uncharacterized protein YuzE